MIFGPSSFACIFGQYGKIVNMKLESCFWRWASTGYGAYGHTRSPVWTTGLVFLCIAIYTNVSPNLLRSKRTALFLKPPIPCLCASLRSAQASSLNVPRPADGSRPLELPSYLCDIFQSEVASVEHHSKYDEV